jgi:hypothetical protein
MKVNIINKSAYLATLWNHSITGMDLRANLTESITTTPRKNHNQNGSFIELPIGYEAQVRPRSGSLLSKRNHRVIPWNTWYWLSRRNWCDFSKFIQSNFRNPKRRAYCATYYPAKHDVLSWVEVQRYTQKPLEVRRVCGTRD